MPPERREIKRAHVSPIVVGGGGTEGRTFKARPAPKATITPAEAAKMAVEVSDSHPCRPRLSLTTAFLTRLY